MDTPPASPDAVDGTCRDHPMHADGGPRRTTNVFSTADDAYVPKAVVAVLSFRRHNPHVDAHILSSRMSLANRTLCERCGITPIEVDLSSAFYRSWRYPSECYSHFKAPDIFLPLGYRHSIYVDGDTYSDRPFPRPPAEPFHLAGASYDTVGEFFTKLGELDRVRGLFPAASGFQRDRIQAGVLLYDNQALATSGYFERARALFDASVRGDLPRKGDDSLLALLLAVHPEVRTVTLPRSCNCIDMLQPATGAAAAVPETPAAPVVFHFVRHKPWEERPNRGDPAAGHLAEKWRETMINHFPDDDIARCFPHLHRPDAIGEESVRFFWWTGGAPNFGDWITPYLVRRACGRDPGPPADPTKTRENVILAVGSIMRLCGPNTVVWGSGIRDRNQEIVPGRRVRSVRGPLTRRRLLEVGGECPPVYGDPALLLPRFHRPRPGDRRFRLGVVPHFTQYRAVRALYEGDGGVTVIDLRTSDVEAVVDRIAACDAIASSSLHGIVVANAYGVPVRWVKFDTDIMGDDTKFHDHFASIGRPDETCIDAVRYRKIDADELVAQTTPYEIDIDLDRLWEASPFHDGRISRYVRYLLS